METADNGSGCATMPRGPDDRLIVARHSMVANPRAETRVGDPGCNAAPTRLVQRDQEIHTLAANPGDQAAGLRTKVWPLPPPPDGTLRRSSRTMRSSSRV